MKARKDIVWVQCKHCYSYFQVSIPTLNRESLSSKNIITCGCCNGKNRILYNIRTFKASESVSYEELLIGEKIPPYQQNKYYKKSTLIKQTIE